jgi:RND family efflux transporter MFP subunit
MLGCVLGCLLAFPCTLSAAPAPQPATVRTMAVQEVSVPDRVDYHGVVRSRNAVDVVPLVAARVKTVHVKAGQKVSRGDLLVELEDAEFRARADAAEARFAAADSDRAEANRQFQRINALFPQGSATREELDGAATRRQAAEAAAKAAEAQLEEARAAQRHTQIRSPLSGVVLDKKVNPGDFAMPGLPPTAGLPTGRVLLNLYDPEALWFEAPIPERHSAAVQVGGVAEVVVPAANLAAAGKFIEVVPGIDEGSRTFLARLELAPAPALKVGMLGQVRFAAGQRQALVIPAEALLRRGQLDTVFLAANSRAQLRLVRPGKPAGDRLEILSGLAAGEVVILNPWESLRDGDPVSTQPAQP